MELKNSIDKLSLSLLEVIKAAGEIEREIGLLKTRVDILEDSKSNDKETFREMQKILNDRINKN